MQLLHSTLLHSKYPMNILVLTPDAVGSTLLQRLITIYMQFHQFDKPVINLHELTNGLQKYYSQEFNKELLGKPFSQPWGYYQTLEEVTNLLSQVDHYKTARLAQYHIVNRQDTLAQQLPFYRYLDDNFFVIAARRSNLFEHALSWAINSITKKLNVYNAQEKIDTFIDLYRKKITVDSQSLLVHLNRYKDYLAWSARHFTIGSYFHYEQHLPSIEKYILGLPIFAGQPRLQTWKETYDIEFETWNRCHYYGSNLGSIALADHNQLQIADQSQSADNQLATLAKSHVLQLLPQDQKDFLHHNQEKYSQTQQSHRRMQELGILVGTVPIKKQTLAEKLFMVQNVDQCVETYNRWLESHPEVDADPADLDSLKNQAKQEWQIWSTKTAPVIESTRPSVWPKLLP